MNIRFWQLFERGSADAFASFFATEESAQIIVEAFSDEVFIWEDPSASVGINYTFNGEETQ